MNPILVSTLLSIFLVAFSSAAPTLVIDTVYALNQAILADTAAPRPTCGWTAFNKLILCRKESTHSALSSILDAKVVVDKNGAMKDLVFYESDFPQSIQACIESALTSTTWIWPNRKSSSIWFKFFLLPPPGGEVRSLVVRPRRYSLSSTWSSASPDEYRTKEEFSRDSTYFAIAIPALESSSQSTSPQPVVGWDSLARLFSYTSLGRDGAGSFLALVDFAADGTLISVRARPMYPEELLDIKAIFGSAKWKPATAKAHPVSGKLVFLVTSDFRNDEPIFKLVIVQH